VARIPFVRALIASALPLCLVLPSPVARGQGLFGPMRGAQSGRFIQAPRSVQQQLREAEQALAEDRYSDAVVRLGDLLSLENEEIDDMDLAGQDFFLDIDESRAAGRPVRDSLMRTARRMIGQLPLNAQETYELRYGPLARKLLTEAAASRDWEQVRDVRRKYFHTKAGYEASAILTQNELFGGHPLAASLLLDDVVVWPRAVSHLGNGVLTLHAAAARLARRDLPSLAASSGRAVTIGGQSDSIPDSSELEPWLDQRVGRLDDFAGGERTDYPMFGASPSRNGVSSGQLPLSNLRWMLDTTASPRQERSVRQVAEELATTGKLPPPSWTPLRVGDQLLMRTTERLVGVDYRTGKRIWVYPWESNYEYFDEEDASLDGMPGEKRPGDLLTQRVWNDLPYGRVTTDGTRAYLLDDLREVEVVPISPMINLRGTRPADTGTNTLLALDLASEGKLRWKLGKGSDEASTLSNAFFLGPPLPIEGRLYVMAEMAGDINLCCLDPETGVELWRQQLVAVESGGIETDPIRRVAGAMPTYHEGLLICPTGAGATVAIDLADRLLRWGVNYDRNIEMIRSVGGRSRGLETNQLLQRWASGSAIAAENTVLITPIETDRLFGFDLLTGENLFPKKNRVHMRYLAGIRDGRFYVVGSNQVQAFQLRDGKPVTGWQTRDLLSAGQQISGFGVFGEDNYLLPTTSNQIVRISLSDGSVIDRRNTNYPLGNLVAVGGEVIAQGPTTLAVAFGEATLEPLVNRLLEQDPNDFEAMVRKSELLIQHGQRQEALELLTRARQMEPDNDEVRMLSVSALLGMLREDLTADDQLVKTLDKLIDRPTQRVELLSLRIRAALKNEAYVDAAQRLVDLSSLIAFEPLLESAADEVVDDASRNCSLDGWLAARVQELAGLADERELKQINLLIATAVQPRLTGSKNLLRRIVRHFGAFDGAASIRDELAQRLRGEKAYLDLERLALATEIPSGEGLMKLSPPRLAMLAEAYARGGMGKDADAVLDRLEALNTELEPGRLEEFRELARPRVVLDWPRQVSLNWSSRESRIRSISESQRVAETNILAGHQFDGWRLVSEGTSRISMRDPNGLLRRIQMQGLRQVNEMDKQAQICGGIMVVVMPNGLIAIDLYQLLANQGEPILWRRGLSADNGPVARRRSAITPFDDQVVRYYVESSVASSVMPEFKLGPIMGDRVLLLQGGDLMAIDLLTKETLWRNSAAPKSGAVLSDGGRVAVVSPATGEVVFFDLLDGRQLDTASWQHGEIWESIGTNVLSYQETDRKGRFEIKVVNPFSGDVLLQQETDGANRSTTNAPCAYGRVVAGRYMTLLDHEGQATVWDVMEAREIGRPKLPPYPNLQGLRAMLLEGQIILLPKRRIDRKEAIQPQANIQTTDGSFHRTIHGVHAISLVDGSLRWQHQFEKPWGCTLTQPSQTPVLLLTRSPFIFTTISRRKTLDALALDVRDGSELDRTVGKKTRENNNQLESRLTIQPSLSRVIAHFGTEYLTYTFGEVSEEQPGGEQP
jgi:outer membrane protein assembly factor BamB